MASQATGLADVCVVCLQSRPLKLVGKCKHRFCSKCLFDIIEGKEGDVFACPTCKVDCLCPTDGLEGLVDFTGGDEAAEDAGVEEGRRGGVKDLGVVPGVPDRETTQEPGTECADTVLDVRCKICHQRKKEVQAVNLCVECGHLYICNTCTDVHSRNKATREHVVVPLRKKDICKPHDSLLNSYCQDCKKPVCMVCIMWEHGEHSIEKLGDFVDGKVAALNQVLKRRAKRLRELQHQMYELMALIGEAAVFDKEDMLVKEIEDHAEKCIAGIVKWMDDLKNQVKANHKVIRDLPEDLEKVQKAVEQLQRPIERAVELLGKKEHHLLYLDKLLIMQQEVAAVADVGNDIKDTGHWSQILELHNYNYHFIPGELPSDLGGISKTVARPCESIAEVIFKHTIQADSTDMFIPCVANLGFNFAVAHPTRHREPSGAIDIYELPGTLKRTFKAHVPPLYDMSSTPDGKLSVLSDGSGGNNCRVKLFDVENGYMSCTGDIDIAKPLSLGVTTRHQYAIIGRNGQGEVWIIITDKEGIVLFKHQCDTAEKIYWNPEVNPRITCSRDFIFVAAMQMSVTYKLQDAGLLHVSTGRYIGSLTDISATVMNDLFRICTWKNNVNLYRHKMRRGTKYGWDHRGQLKVCDEEASCADMGARLSTRDGHIVVTYGRTIRVFKLL
ncbi:uncharacterized protein LOC135501816 [Lineus longissimus]|uniref:uncharacterized protein LOC135501816 n=1 Tax=Lineus longissimus TaxID=88925 RepID=UPI00315C7111